jgi:hypothetical protein
MNAALPRVGLFQPYPNGLGGMQRVLIQLARALPRAGWDPIFIVPEAGRFTAALDREQLDWLWCDPGPAWHVYHRGRRGLSYLLSPRRVLDLARYWRRLAGELRTHGIAVLHCNDYRGVALAAPAGRLAGRATLWHMHGILNSTLATLAASALARCKVPVSEGMLACLGIPRRWLGRVEVIPNGVALPAAPPQTKFADMPAPPVVLALGRLHPCKNFELLLAAFDQMARQHPDAECWVAGGDSGDAAYGKQLRERAARLRAAGRVKFLGHCDDVPALLRRCAVLAVPSHVETFSLVAVEAMLAGKPVVAARTGGLNDVVAHGETGLLVPPGDTPAFARALLEILADPLRARRLGEAGRQRAQARFGVERMARDFATLYARLAGPDLETVRPAVPPSAAPDESTPDLERAA